MGQALFKSQDESMKKVDVKKEKKKKKKKKEGERRNKNPNSLFWSFKLRF